MVFSHNSELNGHLVMFDDGVTAIQSKNGNTWRRLQLQNINDDVVFFKSTDGGVTWPTENTRTLLTNADLDGHLFMNTSHTGIDAGTGTTRYRLQINPDGEIALYKSTDSGASWPGKKTIANFE